MAKEYFDNLNIFLDELNIKNDISLPFEVRHFFSGAALYINNKICASLSPSGLAFKLGDDEADILIKSGKAKPLKYFDKGRIKKGYVLFERPNFKNKSKWKRYFIKASKQV